VATPKTEKLRNDSGATAPDINEKPTPKGLLAMQLQNEKLSDWRCQCVF